MKLIRKTGANPIDTHRPRGLVSLGTALALIAATLVAISGIGVVTATPAQAVGSYDNTLIADTAMRFLGQYGGAACVEAGRSGAVGGAPLGSGNNADGECKAFVNCVVWIASGHTQWPAPGYHSGFQGAGAQEISLNDATKGDIIQVDTADHLHTTIVLSNLGGGRYHVVDSNWSYTHEVSQHDWTAPAGSRAWRLGSGQSAPTGPVDVIASNNSGQMAVQLTNFPLGTAYFFCHNGSGYPSGGSVPNHGQITVSSPNQSWSSGWCSGSGNFWVGIQAPDGHDYYSNQVTLGLPEFSLTPAPVVTGRAHLGQALTARPGVWQPAPDGFNYQWLRSGAAISGATETTYTLTAADLGATISVRVTGSKTGYASVTRTSASTVKVEAAAALTAATPTISGKPTAGTTLTSKPGNWAPAPVTLSYQWLRNGKIISAATKATYALTVADLGAAISVRVTGSKTGYTSITKTSASTTKVTAGTLTPTKPKITGKAKVGKTLTAKPGIWKPAGISLTYQWKRNGKAIKNATTATYKLTKADKGKRITVTVTGHKPGYTTLAKTSKKTGKVK